MSSSLSATHPRRMVSGFFLPDTGPKLMMLAQVAGASYWINTSSPKLPLQHQTSAGNNHLVTSNWALSWQLKLSVSKADLLATPPPPNTFYPYLVAVYSAQAKRLEGSQTLPSLSLPKPNQQQIPPTPPSRCSYATIFWLCHQRHR